MERISPNRPEKNLTCFYTAHVVSTCPEEVAVHFDLRWQH